MDNKIKVALLEDDLAQAKLLRQWLSEEGYEVCHRDSVAGFTEMLAQQPVDLAILDWQLPDATGIEALNWIRNHYQDALPVLFSTQRDSEEDVVEALKAGADDYMIKPPRRAELMARLSAIGRRIGLEKLNSPRLELAHIVIDQDAQKVFVHDEEVKLTRKDFLLACCVIKNQGKLLSREYLLKEVWGVAADINTRTVDMHISRMRRNLQLDPSCGFCIKTVYQHGYRLEQVDD